MAAEALDFFDEGACCPCERVPAARECCWHARRFVRFSAHSVPTACLFVCS